MYSERLCAYADAPKPVCTCLCKLWDGLFDFPLFLPFGRRNVFVSLPFLKKTQPLAGVNGHRLQVPLFRFVILTPIIKKPALSCLSQGPNNSASEDAKGDGTRVKAPAGAEFFAGSSTLHTCEGSAPTDSGSRYRTCLNLWDQLISATSLSSLTSLCVLFRRADLYDLEKEPWYWDAQARTTLDAALKLRPREHRAKNIILFLGDGEAFPEPGALASYLTVVFHTKSG